MKQIQIPFKYDQLEGVLGSKDTREKNYFFLYRKHKSILLFKVLHKFQFNHLDPHKTNLSIVNRDLIKNVTSFISPSIKVFYCLCLYIYAWKNLCNVFTIYYYHMWGSICLIFTFTIYSKNSLQLINQFKYFFTFCSFKVLF